MAAILEFISVFYAGSSVYNFKDNLFKILVEIRMTILSVI